jgi:uncharacterized membrane protein
MAPLLVLLTVTALLRLLGALGVRGLRWHAALRGGLAAMFVVTGVSHFTGMRADLVAMVPPALPAPGLLVTVTGVLELAGAAALLHRRTAPWAAGALAVLLVAMFPANAYAAIEGLNLDGRPAMALAPRALLQLLFLAALVAVLRPNVRATTAARAARPGRVSV